MKKPITFFLVMSVIFSCSRKTAPITSRQAVNLSGETIEVTLTPVDMTVAESLFKQTCSKCHALPPTAKHTALEWPNTINRMQLKAGFDVNQKTLITAYLAANARQ